VRESPLKLALLSPEQVTEGLARYRAPYAFQQSREAWTVWKPLYEEFLELVEETMVDHWPFQNYPGGWSGRVSKVTSRVDSALSGEVLCHYPQRSDSNFGVVLDALKTAAGNPKELTGRTVGLVRSITKESETKRGEIGSQERRRFLKRERDQFFASDLEPVRRALIESVSSGGVLSLNGKEIPAEFLPLIEMGRPQSLKTHLGKDYVVSPDALVKYLPYLSSQVEEGQGRRVAVELVEAVWSVFPGEATPSQFWVFLNQLLQKDGEAPLLWTCDLEEEPNRELVRATLSGAKNTFYAHYFALPEGGYREALERTLNKRLPPGALARQRLEKQGEWLAWNGFFLVNNIGVKPAGPDAVRSCFQRCLELSSETPSRPYPRLQQHKRLAESWRQMVFVLSHLGVEQRRHMVASMWGEAPHLDRYLPPLVGDSGPRLESWRSRLDP